MLAGPRTFRCPNCNEMINDSMTQCRFCSVAIDPAIAALVGERQEKANQACSDASYLKTAAIAMLLFLAVGSIVGLVFWGFVVTFWVVVVLLIRWQVRFGSLLTDDPDFQQAKRSRTIALVLLIVAIPLGLIVPFLGAITSGR